MAPFAQPESVVIRHAGCRSLESPHLHSKGRTVINDQNSEDIRSLFDWRNVAARQERPEGAAVGNDDLALALQLLSCNFRDREQFVGTRDGAATTA